MPASVSTSAKIDCSWLLCPVPILRTEEKLAAMAPGSVLEVVYTDPGAKPDLEAWCAVNGHDILKFVPGKPASSAFVKKGGRS